MERCEIESKQRRRENVLKNYSVESGEMGYIPEKGYILFSSDREYEEWLKEHEETESEMEVVLA